jgi:hypothetical protein
MANSDMGADMSCPDISWPDLTPLPINLWSLPNFEQAARRHPPLISRRVQLMQHLELMQSLLTTDGTTDVEADGGGDGRGGEGLIGEEL